MTKKKKCRIMFGIAAALLLIIGGNCVLGVKQYVDRVPQITPYEGCTFAKNCTLLPDDLAEITAADSSLIIGKYISEVKWTDGTTDALTISADRTSVSVGDKTGTLTVWIRATGVEAREAEATVQITE